VWKDLGEAASIIKAESETLPVKENQAAYREAYALYGELYPTLAPLFKMGGKN